MMRVLVVYCHPCEESFNRAIRDLAMQTLIGAGHDVRLLDLYAIGFDPAMSAEERRDYHTESVNENRVAEHLALVRWAESLVFVYPTWWFGLPAMLKGWCDRVLVPHATFVMPTASRPIAPLLTNIRRLTVVTTCGASWLVSKFVGEPGRRTLLRGVRSLCHPACGTRYLAHYKMDTSTETSRARFLARVENMLRLMT
jgi:NAD(P)H dehydrogenase (quinone)